MSWLKEYLEGKKRIEQSGLTLELVEWGIANRTGNTIILNKNIFKYPEYAKEIITHEIKHTSKDFTIKDLQIDIFEGSLFDNLLFCFKHPYGFYQFSPIIFHNKNMLFDLNLVIIYLIALFLIMGFILIG